MSVTAVKLLRLPAQRAARGLAENLAQRALDRRPPVQAAVDVAVPLEVAWEEWMSFDAFTEGTHRIESIRRKGRKLTGHANGVPGAGADWKAEVVEERKHEAFAWRSVEGTDTAGLVTFHRLSDRLTRIELELDVLPTGPIEVLLLGSGLASRRAAAELRRFKARVEFISPDAYDNPDASDNQ